MKRALTLARGALGTTSPNPAVGAVLVKDRAVVGEGHTMPPGQAHAEIVALQQAGPLARGATLYVTLEPCCTYGLTGPCTRALIEAGVERVYMAIEDPNPKVSGRGRADLEASGIPVQSGEGTEEAAHLYRCYAKHIVTGLPYIIAKFAASLDGKIATASGDSRWITGPSARERGQKIRREVDAILVGVNTVLKDDPQLTARDEAGRTLPRQPLRVVVDSQTRTPPSARLLAEPGHTVIATTRESSKLQQPDVEELSLPADAGGRVQLSQLLAALGQRGVVSMLVEGGGQILGSLFDEGLVDEVMAFIAPMVIGGAKAPAAVAGIGPLRLPDAARLRRVTVERCDDDILVTGYPGSRC
jgi:diaminohydroxyphosphoribosylaminopyrimidine deaminase/5-amino-6-(5-phosphoribosylamino)uracil reductase